MPDSRGPETLSPGLRSPAVKSRSTIALSADPAPTAPAHAHPAVDSRRVMRASSSAPSAYSLRWTATQDPSRTPEAVVYDATGDLLNCVKYASNNLRRASHWASRRHFHRRRLDEAS